MDIELPTVPAGIITLLSLVAPYGVALINRPAWSATTKKLVSVGVAVVLAAAVLAFYFVYTGEPVPAWPALVLLSIVVMQSSYALVTREAGARAVERRSGGSE